MGDTIQITYRHGWALMEDVETGRTALCLPRVIEGPPQSFNFEIVGWHETYKDAHYVVAVMQAGGVSVDDYMALRDQPPLDEQEPELIEGAVEPEPEPEKPKRKRRRPASLLTLW